MPFGRLRLLTLLPLTALALGSAPGVLAEEEGLEDLGALDIEDLLEIEITSVSKSAESLFAAAASVSVVTNEEIRRSGASSIPEALRLVPGVDVARVSANSWAVSARGFNNNFANKLLVLIDGRSVYSPLFGGVYWDTQALRMDDIERIEVVRGPGGTVYGANAVNGVINVITKHSERTHGLAAEAGYGNLEPTGNARYGGQAGDAHWRVYVNGFQRNDFDFEGGGGANDGYSMVQGGFRGDWEMNESHSFTLQGDGYGGADDDDNPFEAEGGNVLFRWNYEQSELSKTSVQVYFDHQLREQITRERRNTTDIDFQHDWSGLDPLTITWGSNFRISTDDITAVTDTALSKQYEAFKTAGGFLQGQYEILEDVLVATAGTKLDWNSFTGFEYQPSGRVRWTPVESHTIWGAISRAVRLPTRVDRDLDYDLGLIRIRGNEDFESEDLLAFEMGYRTTPIPELAFEVSGFFFQYENLRTTSELTGPTDLTFENNLDADTWGVDVETTWQVIDDLRLVFGYTFFDGDSNPTGPIALEDNAEDANPNHKVTAQALIDLPWNLELDTWVSWTAEVSGSPGNPIAVPIDDYVRLDVRIGWQPTDHWEFSLSGQNLVEDEHVEFFDSQALGVVNEIPRSVFGKATFRY